MQNIYQRMFEKIFTWIYEHRVLLIVCAVLTKVLELSEEEQYA